MATPAHKLLQHAQRSIAKRRFEKAQYFAGLLFLIGVPSDQLDPKRDFEWIELQRAAETHGKKYGVPSYETRLMIVTLLREYEFRKGRAA